jgi:alanine racemase
MTRPIQALVHRSALKHNLSRIKSLCPSTQILAVVKANAYGHGIERVYEGLRGADGFGVLEVSEAKRLRDLGWRGPILLLEGVFDARELEECSRHKLWHTIHCQAQIDWLVRHKTHEPHRVFLKMNSGMNRLGFPPESFKAAYTRLDACPQVQEISLMTHFSDADQPLGVSRQLATFQAHASDLGAEISLCNSAAALIQPKDLNLGQDWARIGIALYGGSVNPQERSAQAWGLKPALTFKSEVIAIQHVRAGQSVGYGSTFTATQDMRIGIVACGYADGYPRHAETGTPVLVHGVRTQTVGRVSMDMLAVDLEPLQSTGLLDSSPMGVGLEVTLWGESSLGTQLSIDEVAHSAGTLSYELMCGLSTRVPIHLDEGADDNDAPQELR